MMKLLGSTESKITKNENRENVSNVLNYWDSISPL